MSSPRRSNRLGIFAVISVLSTLVGCQTGTWRTPLDLLQRPGQTHALLLNGGGRPAINYRSHLDHIARIADLLERRGVTRDRIVVFSGDGDDPGADLAIRAAGPDVDFWLLPEDQLARFLRPPIERVSSTLDHHHLRPATKAALGAWFDDAGARLGRGDTLLLYVTDHGNKNAEDLTNNTIVLWGEELTVQELRALLAGLAPDVRVVMLMSQCFSGGFAHVAFGEDADLPEGNVCGYFSSTADRPAYGCYPENLGKRGVGHSFRFLDALESLGSFPAANERVQVTDRTPDVPHTSADFFLDRLLHREAEAASTEFNTFVDTLLEEAWTDRAAWEREIRLLDRMGHRFGSFSPRTLAELQAQSQAFPALIAKLDTYGSRWRAALGSLKVENLRRFLVEDASWRPRLQPGSLGSLDAEERTRLGQELIEVVVPFTERDATRYARLQSLRQKTDDANAASYRTEIRLAAVLRMRSLLVSIAGRQFLQTRGKQEERDAYQRLVACQNLVLDPNPSVASAADLEAPEPFPPLEEERRLVERVMPGWMGIRYDHLSAEERAKHRILPGAVHVVTVYPDSPASVATLDVGDIVLGPPDAPFDEPNRIREWTMVGEIGGTRPLMTLRNGRRRQVTLRLDPYPVEMPELPGPPQVGTIAPSLNVDVFRGPKRLATNRPRMLFFWATWCGICKTALPEMLAYAEEQNVELVAVTDEDAATLTSFFKTFDEPFPATIVTDNHRITFQSYGVSGIPTFVLIDADGIVRHYRSGYRQAAGLGIDGWKWRTSERG